MMMMMMMMIIIIIIIIPDMNISTKHGLYIIGIICNNTYDLAYS